MRWIPSKIKTGFALFPVTCECGTVVWLERFWYVTDLRCRSDANFKTRIEAEQARDAIHGPPPEVRG